MKKLVSTNESPRYRKFINQRDQALEKIYRDSQVEISDLLRLYLKRILDLAHIKYSLIPNHNFFSSFSKNEVKHIQHSIEQMFHELAQLIYPIYIRTRIISYTLAHVGEVEAIGRSLGKPQEAKITNDVIHSVVSEESPFGGNVYSRIHLYLNRLARDMVDQIELSRVLEEPVDQMLKRLMKVFPKPIFYKQPPRILKPIKEAKKIGPDGSEVDEYDLGDLGFASGIISDDVWNQVVEQYKKDYVPKYRGEEYSFDIQKPDEPDLTEYFDWEIEKEMNEDFVSQVRSGQIDAANENGIKDFTWISIIDKKTDDCCFKRNGLSSSEIENKLDGEWKDDECQATVPPAHPNCRCTLAPLTDDIPTETPPDFGDFEEWLQTK